MSVILGLATRATTVCHPERRLAVSCESQSKDPESLLSPQPSAPFQPEVSIAFAFAFAFAFALAFALALALALALAVAFAFAFALAFCF
jgi:hypothetical protein